MASLEALTKSYRERKAEVSKMRKKSENSLRETLSLKRRSSSGLASLQRRKEVLEREASHVAQLLNQYRSQKESIARLKTDAEERLKHDLDVQDSTKQQIDFGPVEEKASAQERMRSIEEKISEIRASMKEREAAEGRLERQIADLEKEKTRLDSQLKKQAHARPGLVEQLKTSERAELLLRPKVRSLIKREEQTTKALQSAEKKLAESLAKRRRAKKARSHRRRPKRSAKTKARRPVRASRKSGTRKKAKAGARKNVRKAARKKAARRIHPRRTGKSRGSRPRRK